MLIYLWRQSPVFTRRYRCAAFSAIVAALRLVSELPSPVQGLDALLTHAPHLPGLMLKSNLPSQGMFLSWHQRRSNTMASSSGEGSSLAVQWLTIPLIPRRYFSPPLQRS
ncbi:uncharacterized protein BDV14DRAFT_169768 [Aspergillus stella-maris]|uniref:uncharacterized protein n=1 Tax=Aspergillus stella-maris TaxID=1810926 RepID=UPI003CCD7421